MSNHHYLDKVENFREKLQAGEIVFNGETDRVYLNSPDKLFIEDTDWARRIVVESSGSNTTIVWNPWDKVSTLKDMTDDSYQYFVCVETANAANNSISLAPGRPIRFQLDTGSCHWGRKRDSMVSYKRYRVCLSPALT